MRTEPTRYYRKASGLRVVATTMGVILLGALVIGALLYSFLSDDHADARCRMRETTPCDR